MIEDIQKLIMQATGPLFEFIIPLTEIKPDKLPKSVIEALQKNKEIDKVIKTYFVSKTDSNLVYLMLNSVKSINVKDLYKFSQSFKKDTFIMTNKGETVIEVDLN